MTDHLSVRLPADLKKDVVDLAHRLGFDDVSEFVQTLLLSMVDRYGDTEWRSSTLFLDGDKIVKTPSPHAPLGAYLAFGIVAPDLFWRHLDHLDLRTQDEEP